MYLDIKYLDVVDLTADNISCKTLSIDGEPIDQTLTTNQVEAISGTFTNRDLTKCDANGNGNAGEDPNQGYNRFKVWGYSEFYSMLMIKRRQNPGDFYNYFGPCMQITNSYQKTEYLTFGLFRPAYTSTQFGHDFNLQVNSSMNQYIYYGPGNYKNKLVIDANGLIASQVSSFCMQMPCLRLDVNADGVVPAGGVSCTSGVLRVVINSFGYVGPVPNPGQYISVVATPSSLSRDYMQITSVTVGAETVILATATGMADATSTAVESVYFGPKVTSDGSTTITVLYDNGPLPEVGQYIRVTCTNSAFNTATDGNPITSISVGGLKTTLTYTVGTAVPAATAVVTACSLKFDSPALVADPKGILSNIGIHNSNPTSPLDVIGNVTFRDNVTKFPVFKTLTDTNNQSQVQFCDSTQSANRSLATFDCLNNIITFEDTSASSNRTFMTINSTAQTLTVGKPNNIFSLWDGILGRWAVGNAAVQQIAAFGGFLCSTFATFIGTVQVSSPSSMTQASQAVNLVIGTPGTYNVFRTDVFNKRVAVNLTAPQYDLHVYGEAYRQFPHVMGLYMSPGQSIPNWTTGATNLIWTTRDTRTDYGPGTQRTTGTGVVNSPFVNAGLGLTLDPTTGQFKYATVGSISTKVFTVSGQVGFASNATGWRQVVINVYDSSGSLIRNMGAQNINAASGVASFINFNQNITISNNESFAINVAQNSGGPLSIQSANPFYTNVQISHA